MLNLVENKNRGTSLNKTPGSGRYDIHSVSAGAVAGADEDF